MPHPHDLDSTLNSLAMAADPTEPLTPLPDSDDLDEQPPFPDPSDQTNRVDESAPSE